MLPLTVGLFLGPPHLEQNLEIRLIRKLMRWDLRVTTLYSSACVYDVTFIARGNIYQSASFFLIAEFKGTHKTGHMV